MNTAPVDPAAPPSQPSDPPASPAEPGSGTPPSAPAKPAPAPVPDPARPNPDLENQLKERDRQIAELQTTVQTLQSRFEQVNKVQPGKVDEKTLERAKGIMQKAALDPDSAAQELTQLLQDTTASLSQDVVAKAQGVIVAQQKIAELRKGIKDANPEFDDDIVEVIMGRANELALTGKYKQPEEAIRDATAFVKQKFDTYANKKNAAPPLPPGAGAEGRAPLAPAPPAEPPLATAEQELDKRREKTQSKII